MAATRKESEEGKRIQEHMDMLLDLGEKSPYFANVSRMLGKDNIKKAKEAFNTAEERKSLFEFIYIYGGGTKAYSQELKGILESAEGPEDAVNKIKERLDKLGKAGITAESVMKQRNDTFGTGMLARYDEEIGKEPKRLGAPALADINASLDYINKQLSESMAERLGERRAPVAAARLTPAGALLNRKDLADITDKGGHGVTVTNDRQSVSINLSAFVDGSKGQNMMSIGYIYKENGETAKITKVMENDKKGEVNLVLDNNSVISVKIKEGEKHKNAISIEYQKADPRGNESREISFDVNKSGKIEIKEGEKGFPVFGETQNKYGQKIGTIEESLKKFSQPERKKEKA